MKKLQLNLVGGKYIFKKFNKRRRPDKKGRGPTKVLKINQQEVSLFGNEKDFNGGDTELKKFLKTCTERSFSKVIRNFSSPFLIIREQDLRQLYLKNSQLY